MRHLVRGIAPVLALAVLTAPASTSAATKPLACGTVAAPTGSTGPVTVTGASCRTGRRVARTFATKGRVGGWSCVARPYAGGASVSCRKRRGTARVRFEVAD